MEREYDRRVSTRVEEILNGWWRLPGEKFRRCKTLDVSLEGALLVMDSELGEDTRFELHLDMDAEWSVALNGTVLWQRPIFFGKQQLTAVSYRFQQSSDQSMFGLWMQRKLKTELRKGLQEHLAPLALPTQGTSEEHVLEPAPRIQFLESPWKRLLGSLTAKIPWIESEPLPQERRRESRGEVGLSVSLETESEIVNAEFLNVSLSGVCVYVPDPDSTGGMFSGSRLEVLEGQRMELVVSRKSMLLGARRCKAEVVWRLRAEGPEKTSGMVAGLRFTDSPNTVKHSFVGDLLKRINYNVRQARSELRFPRRLPVKVEIAGQSVIEGHTLDISAGGASLLLSQELEVPCNAVVRVELVSKGRPVGVVGLSSRLLRYTVDNEGRNCYAVAFRKGQHQERIKLLRWLANQLRMQELDELIPEFEGATDGMSE